MKVVDESLPCSTEGTAPSNPWLIAFILFASYCLTANLAIALHEFGHGLGHLRAGGKLFGFFLQPQGYAGSYAAYDFSIPYRASYGPLLRIGGGPVIGAAFGLALIPFARVFKRGSVGWIVSYGTMMWCIAHNGAYFFLPSLHPFGDTFGLIELGVPRWVLFLAGLPLVIAFPPLFASFLVGIGMKRRDSYG